jgi:hypothetical protein
MQVKTSVVLNAEILRFAQDDQHTFDVGWILRTFAAAV